MSSIGGSEHQQIAADAAQLARLGYRQQLTRRLSLWSDFAVGFTYLSPVVGVYALFAYGLATAGPAFIWTIPIVVVGQFFVVLVFAEVASQYPIAGGIYQWTKNLVGPRYAWFSGWFYGWVLLATIASISFSSASYVGPLFGFEVTRWTTVATAIVILAIAAAINLSGVRNLALVATLGVAAEIVGTVVLGIVFLFHNNHQSVSSLAHTAGTGSGGYAGAFLAALLFSVWIFYGFEGCGDVAEEVVNPSQKVPRAMMMTLLVGGAVSFFITLSYILAIPSFAAVINGSDANPIVSVIDTLGTFGSKVALVMVLIAFLSCALAVQAAATRLIFSYARDGMIVGSGVLSAVSRRFHMPPGAVAVAFVIPALITLMPTATVARIIAFATVGIYIAFLTVTVAAAIARLRGWTPGGVFRLGRGSGWTINALAIAYGAAAVIIICDKTPPYGSGFVDRWIVPIGAAVVAGVGLVYLLVLRPKLSVREDALADGAPVASTAMPVVESMP